MNKKQKQTIIFDFDGVIHSYKSGWQGATIIPDPPVEGIKEVIDELRKEYKVVVVSTRCYQEGGFDGNPKGLINRIKNFKPWYLVEQGPGYA